MVTPMSNYWQSELLTANWIIDGKKEKDKTKQKYQKEAYRSLSNQSTSSCQNATTNLMK